MQSYYFDISDPWKKKKSQNRIAVLWKKFLLSVFRWCECVPNVVKRRSNKNVCLYLNVCTKAPSHKCTLDDSIRFKSFDSLPMHICFPRILCTNGRPIIVCSYVEQLEWTIECSAVFDAYVIFFLLHNFDINDACHLIFVCRNALFRFPVIRKIPKVEFS